jgi:hypothetical protein
LRENQRSKMLPLRLAASRLGKRLAHDTGTLAIPGWNIAPLEPRPYRLARWVKGGKVAEGRTMPEEDEQ